MGWFNHQLVTNMSPFCMPHVQKERLKWPSKHYFSVDLCFVPGNGLQDGQLEVWVNRNVSTRGHENYPFDSWIKPMQVVWYFEGFPLQIAYIVWVFSGHFTPCFDVLLVLLDDPFWPHAVADTCSELILTTSCDLQAARAPATARQGPSKLRHLRRFISKVAFSFFSYLIGSMWMVYLPNESQIIICTILFILLDFSMVNGM